MNRADEQKLVKKAQAGDRDSYGRLVDLYSGSVLAVAYARVGDFTTSQDIAQDTFLVGYTQLSRLRNPKNFGAWLRMIAGNLCRRWHRNQAYRNRLQDDSAALRQRLGYEDPPVASEALEMQETRSLVEKAMENLPLKEREAVLLFYFEGKSATEAANVSGVSATAMRKRLQRARDRLRDIVSAQVEADLTEAAKRRKLSSRVLAAIPLGPSFGKIFPVTAAVPSSWGLGFANLVGKLSAAPMATAGAVVGLCIITLGVLLQVHLNIDDLADRPALSPDRAQISNSGNQAAPDVTVAAVSDGPTTASQQAGQPDSTTSVQALLETFLSGDAVTETDRTPAISGTVRDPSGNPISGAHMELILRNERWEPQHPTRQVTADVFTGEDGSYLLQSVPSDHEMLVFVSHPDWAHNGAHIQPMGGNDHERNFDFSLEYPTTVSGIVVDETGGPIDSAFVFLWGAAHPARSEPDGREEELPRSINAGRAGCFETTITGPNGRFSLTHIPKGWVIFGLGATKTGYTVGYALSKEGAEKAKRDSEAGRSTSWGAIHISAPYENIRVVLKSGGSVVGRVVMDTTGEPVPDTLVMVEGTIEDPALDARIGYGDSVLTDAAGAYRIDDVPAVDVNIVAKLDTSISDTYRIEITPGKTRSLDLRLTPGGGFSGTLYDLTTGKPLPDRHLSYMREGTLGGFPTFVTDSDGRFYAEGLYQGVWRIQPRLGYSRLAKSRHPSMTSRGFPVEVRTGEITSGIELFAEPYVESFGSLRGKVVDIAGRPVPNAVVWTEKDSFRRAITDSRGEFALQRLVSGSQIVGALSPPDFTFGMTSTEIVKDRESLVTIVLDSGTARIGGVVLTSEGKPPVIPISLDLQGRYIFRKKLVLDERGVFDSGPIPPGEYTLFVSPIEEYRIDPPGPSEFRVQEGEYLENVQFTVSRMSGIIAGIAVYADGRPATHKRVIVGAQYGLIHTETDDYGRFRAEPIDGETGYVAVGEYPNSLEMRDFGDKEWAWIGDIPNGTTDLRVVLYPTGTLTGTVDIPTNSEEDIQVSVLGELGYSGRFSYAGGPFSVELQPDTYTIEISYPNTHVTRRDVVISANSTTDVGIIEPLEGSGVILGRVTQSGGGLIDPELTVEIDLAPINLPDSGNYRLRDPVVENGQFRAEQIPSGLYVIALKVGSDRSAQTRIEFVEVMDGQETWVDFDIPIGDGVILGSVSTGEPDHMLRPTIVFLFEPGACPIEVGKDYPNLDSQYPMGVALVSAEGEFQFDHLPPGSFDIAAMQMEQGVCSKLEIQTVTVVPEGEVTVLFDLAN